MALRRVHRASEISVSPTSSCAPSSIELSGGPRNIALEEACQLQLHFGPSWDPYEVWCTRIRSEDIQKASPQLPVDRPAAHHAKGRSSRLARYQMGSIPALAWPVLLSVLALGLNRELVGIFRLDLVGLVFGVMTPAARVVQVLFGISAIGAVVMALRLAGHRPVR